MTRDYTILICLGQCNISKCIQLFFALHSFTESIRIFNYLRLIKKESVAIHTHTQRKASFWRNFHTRSSTQKVLSIINPLSVCQNAPEQRKIFNKLGRLVALLFMCSCHESIRCIARGEYCRKELKTTLRLLAWNIVYILCECNVDINSKWKVSSELPF